MKLSKRERYLIAIALAAVALFTYYNFFLSNMIDRYLSLKKDIDISQQQLLSLRKEKNAIDSLIKVIDKDKKQIAEMEMVIPSGRKAPEIITQLENISKHAGVKLKGIIFEDSPGENITIAEEKQRQDNSRSEIQDNNIYNKNYVEVPIQLNIEGPYNNIIAFLGAVENFQRLFIVNMFTLNKKQGDGKNLEMQLEMSTFAVEYGQKPGQEPATYDFMYKHYGRQNPFESLQTLIPQDDEKNDGSQQ